MASRGLFPRSQASRGASGGGVFLFVNAPVNLHLLPGRPGGVVRLYSVLQALEAKVQEIEARFSAAAAEQGRARIVELEQKVMRAGGDCSGVDWWRGGVWGWAQRAGLLKSSLQQDGWLTGEWPDRLVRGKAWPFPGGIGAPFWP